MTCLYQKSRSSTSAKSFNTRRLSHLAGNILLLSKIEHQSIQTRQNWYRLDEQIRQSIVMMEPKWSEKEIEFDVDMMDVEYLGNENLICHVWDNLLSNSVPVVVRSISG